MANPHHHTVSSIRKYKLHGPGGVNDYSEKTYDAIYQIHAWFDETKGHLADFRHRALRHHSEGIFLCEKIFGPFITLPDGRKIPTRWIGEQHVREDLGYIPAAADWLRQIKPEPWMNPSRKLHLELNDKESKQAEDYDQMEKELYPDEKKTNEILLKDQKRQEPIIKRVSLD